MCYNLFEDDSLFWINSDVDKYLNEIENRFTWYDEDNTIDSEGAF